MTGLPVWVLDEDFEKPQKEMDFPSVPLGRVSSRKESRNNLRINTHSSVELHDRYMSSEEEPSPSPDSEAESQDEEELNHKANEVHTDDTAEPATTDESKPEIAIAVPILAMGRPKLVDITNLAPMHKRKRIEKPMLSRSAAVRNATSRFSAAVDESSPPAAHKATKAALPEERLPERKDSLPLLKPSSWLPEDNAHTVQDDGHYFPDLELRSPPTYNDYDPYSLDPPCLSPRNSYNSAGKKPGSVARARVSSNPPVATNNWKGFGRSLSLARKQASTRGDQQVAKKPKMIARAANERQETLKIPAFPFADQGVD